MIQGTASSAGKSILVTALCRIFKQDGFSVAPFKAQNMALNSYVTEEGGEIGRSQVVQAEAAGIKPLVSMNPVLLKPEADSRCQVIVMGKVDRTISASDYYKYTPRLLKVIENALESLRSNHDIIVIEGAGSPAEINLRETEIVNMRIAKLAQSPVLLVGDIDRGGVFASIVGTMELLEPEERNLIKGFIINRFRGDVSLLTLGLEMLEKKTERPVLGVVPYLRDMHIAQEDSVYLDDRKDNAVNGSLDAAVIRLPHISNYDDFDPLEGNCHVRYVARKEELGKPHLIILPGTKNTIGDLNYLWQSGLAWEIIRLAGSGTPVIGICGGYQMLGKKILDPEAVESCGEDTPGLGLLDTVTVFAPQKTTTQVRAKVLCGRGILAGMRGQEVTGYEIHMGTTTCDGGDDVFHVFQTPQGAAEYADGALDDNGTVLGTYLHGLLHNRDFCAGLIDCLRERYGLDEPGTDNLTEKEEQYDRLAAVVRKSLDMDAVYQIMRNGAGS